MCTRLCPKCMHCIASYGWGYVLHTNDELENSGYAKLETILQRCFPSFVGEGGDWACGLCGMVARGVRSQLSFFQNTNIAFVYGLEHAAATAPRSSVPGLGEFVFMARDGLVLFPELYNSWHTYVNRSNNKAHTVLVCVPV